MSDDAEATVGRKLLPYVSWGSKVKWQIILRLCALVLLAEQGAEVLFAGASLSEHPFLVIAALGALGAPATRSE